MNRRLRFYDVISDKHCDRKQNPIICELSYPIADIITDRHESHIYSGQEKHQADIGKYESYAYAYKLPFGQFNVNCIKKEEKDEYNSEKYQNTQKAMNTLGEQIYLVIKMKKKNS